MAEIRPLTGLRGVAALSVFLAHLRNTLSEDGIALDFPDWVMRLFLNSGAQVDVFFVLSGFILAMTYRSWFAGAVSIRQYAVFLRRRFARIYPLHLAMLLAVIVLVIGAQHFGARTNHGLERFDPAQLPAYFLLMQAWDLFFDGPGNWNPPSWSVSIEALAYLLFPAIIWLAARLSGRSPWLPMILAAAIGLGLNMFVSWGLSGISGIARGLSEFALGCTAAGFYDSAIARKCQSAAGSWLALACLTAIYWVVGDTAFVIAIACVPLLLALSAPSPVGRFFGWQPVFFLGEISYSIYLGHFLFSSIAYRLVSIAWMGSGPFQTFVGVLLIVAFVIGLSAICYYAIERPGRALLGGRGKAAVARAVAA